MNISGISSALAPSAGAQGLTSKPAARTPEGDRKKVSAQFEAILVRQLLGKSVSSMLGGDSVAGSVYGDMMTDSLATQLTAGQGLGLGRMIEQQLTPRGTPAEKTSTPTQP